jgi:hypothetical protein
MSKLNTFAQVEMACIQPLEPVKATAVAALLHCHSASGTFAVVDTEFGLNLNILAVLHGDESYSMKFVCNDVAHPSLQDIAQCSPLEETAHPRSGNACPPAMMRKLYTGTQTQSQTT